MARHPGAGLVVVVVKEEVYWGLWELWGMRVNERIYVLHELSADWTDLFAERGTEHHDLLLVWRHAEYLLDVFAHVWKRESGHIKD